LVPGGALSGMIDGALPGMIDEVLRFLRDALEPLKSLALPPFGSC
jgi:hypothetical protein